MKGKKYITSLLAAAVIVTSAFPLTAFAVPSDDPDAPPAEEYSQDETPADTPSENPDNGEPSYAEETPEESYSPDYSQDYTEPDNNQYYEPEYSYDDNEYTQQDSYEDYDNNNENEYEYSNDEETYDNEESYEESYEDDSNYSTVTVADPFTLIAGLEVILPADKPDFKPKEESSKEEESKDESSAAAAAIKKDTDLLNAPPTIPIDETVSSVTYTQDENDTSVFVGIIFWSIIGIVITAILIIIINFKGENSEFTFGRKRYHKNNYKPSRTSVNKYKMSR